VSARQTCPAKDSPRAEAQRERILCAAQKCFIEYGFHAASMASIAETAQMSAGLMYRYFENKNAIVLAIIERQLEEGRAQIARMHTSSELAEQLFDVFSRWQARDPAVMNAALFLEMSAQATRDPQIAEALRTSDELIFADFQAWMTRNREDGGLGLPPESVATRAFLLQCFIKGLTVSAVRQPGLEPGALRDAIDKAVDRLLSP
jgi:AcrR family transcriptional regulator